MSREFEQDEIDEMLSAWVDGELSTDDETALRATLERRPELRARVRAFRRVDDALRGAAAPAVSNQLAARILQAIGEQPTDHAVEEPCAERPVEGESAERACVLPMQAARQRRASGIRRLAPLAAALAAGLAVVIVLSTRDSGPASDLAELEGTSPVPASDSDWSDLPKDELETALALALEPEALADFDVVEQLEVLELLVALEDESGGLGS